jgi:hypothetical protein
MIKKTARLAPIEAKRRVMNAQTHENCMQIKRKETTWGETGWTIKKSVL